MNHASFQASPDVYCAPRRFDLATLLVVMIVYSVLFGILTSLQLPIWFSSGIVTYLTLVGLSQAFFFGGKRPRTASLIISLFLAPTAYYTLLAEAPFNTGLLESLGVWLGLLSLSLLAGYIAGAFVGGVFMMAESVRVGGDRKFNGTKANARN